MTFRIDRTRPAVSARSAPRPDADRTDEAYEPSFLPVPVGSVSEPPRPDRRDAESAFEAQLMGQDGQKRGLRAGQPLLDQARATYSRIEWSGANDRRRRAGRNARASI